MPFPRVPTPLHPCLHPFKIQVSHNRRSQTLNGGPRMQYCWLQALPRAPHVSGVPLKLMFESPHVSRNIFPALRYALT